VGGAKRENGETSRRKKIRVISPQNNKALEGEKKNLVGPVEGNGDITTRYTNEKRWTKKKKTVP